MGPLRKPLTGNPDEDFADEVPAPKTESLPAEAPKSGLTGDPAKDFGDAPTITERTPKKVAAHGFDLGLEAHALASGVDKAMMEGSHTLRKTLGIKGLDQGEGDARTPEQNAIEQKQHPLSFGAGEMGGNIVQSIPAFEATEGAAQIAPKVIPALGAAGQALAQGAQAIPGGAKALSFLAQPGNAGAFMGGFTEEFGKSKNIGQAFQTGLAAAGLNAAGGKIGQKLGEMHATHKLKMTQQAEAANLKSVIEHDQNIRDLELQRHKMNAEREQREADALAKRDELMKQHHAQEEARINEMQVATDEQKARLDLLEKGIADREKARLQVQAEKRLSLTKKRAENADKLGPPKRTVAPPPEDPEVLAEVERLKKDLADKRFAVNLERKNHSKRVRDELDAIKRGGPTFVPPQYHPPEVPPQYHPPEVPTAEAPPPNATIPIESDRYSPVANRGNKGRASQDRMVDRETGAEIPDDNALEPDSKPWGPGYSSIDNTPDPEAVARLLQGHEEAFMGGRPTLLGAGPAEAVAWAARALSQIPKSELGYDGVKHFIGMVQKTSDIFGQYDNELAAAFLKAGRSVAELHGGLEELFKNTRAKVAFGRMGAGDIERDIMHRGLQGKLTAAEQATLPSEVTRALNESRAAIQDYLSRVEPVLKWLDENTAEGFFAENSGLGRLRRVLHAQVGELKPTAPNKGEKKYNPLDMLTGAITKSMIVGKAAVSSIHAAEKFATLAAQHGPISLGKAIVAAYKPGAAAKFADEFLGEGILTEAYADVGVKVKSGIGKILTGKPIEQSPNRVTAMLGLDKAAKEAGYANAEALATDLLAARRGKGPLAYDSDKTIKAIRTIQDGVSDMTGLNVPGFRDANLLQRDEKLRLANLFLTARLTQTRNLHNMVGAFVNAKGAKEKGRTAAVLGAYMAAQYIAAGDKGVMPVEGEVLLRNTVGAPNYYNFMDGIHAARAAIPLPSIPHVQVSVSPLVSGGGASAMQIAREMAQVAATGKSDDAKYKVAKAIGVVAGGQLFGMGTGVGIDYATALRDGQRGYKMLKVFQHESLGGERHIADIPVSTNEIKALGDKFWGAHGGEEAELEYQAQKAMDIRQWVHQNGDAEFVKDAQQGERELDEVTEAHELNKEKSEAVNELKDAGFKVGSDEIRKVNEHYTKLSAQGDKQIQLFRARANYWQQRAKELTDTLKRQENPENPGLSSSKAGA